MPKKRRPAAVTPGSKDALPAAIEAARDILRKDAGLNGDIERIPHLAWLLFLKLLDDLEPRRALNEPGSRPTIAPPYRWRDWASDRPGARTGLDLVRFVNDELLPYLRGLSNGDEDDLRRVVASVFEEIHNRIVSGHLLREVLDHLHSVSLATADDLRALVHIYESLLKQMLGADAAAGQFYTPRPVVRFIVQQVAPRLGEVILDPAAGTGGFLVEALEALRARCRTDSEWRELQRNLGGIEKQPLPYLLGVMNLALHEVDRPNLRRGDALAQPLERLQPEDRADVVFADPPFGGKADETVQADFPEATRTAETALLFLQLIQHRLKPGGRCGMVVPDGVLFQSGVATRIRERLLRECQLHTVVRLPPGVFAPYASIRASLIFFEKAGPTTEVWYWEQPPPDGRKNYSQTWPLRFEDFAACQAWWGGPERTGRLETENAWCVPAADIAADDNWNLDRKNPHRQDDSAHKAPEAVLSELIETEAHVTSLLERLRPTLAQLGADTELRDAWREFALGDLLRPAGDVERVSVDRTYSTLGVRSRGRGVFAKPMIDGAHTSARELVRVRSGQFIYSRRFADEGAFGLIPAAFDGWFISSEFAVFDCDDDRVTAEFLACYFHSPRAWAAVSALGHGPGPGRQRLRPEQLLKHRLLVPPRHEQDRIVAAFHLVEEVERLREQQQQRTRMLMPSFLHRATRAVTRREQP